MWFLNKISFEEDTEKFKWLLYAYIFERGKNSILWVIIYYEYAKTMMLFINNATYPENIWNTEACSLSNTDCFF